MTKHIWKGFYMKLLNQMISYCLCLILICSAVIPVSATDSVDTLTQSTNDLQNQLTSLNQELTSLSNEIASISAQANAITAEITTVKSELAIAKGKEASQYEAMKTRIKYMYENGNANMFELLLTSSCMAEFLRKADFISTVAEYDRALLEDLTRLQKEIEEKEAALVEKQTSLSALQSSLAEKEASLQSKISSVSTDLAAQSAELEAAKLRAEEEARKAREEALKAEEALKQEIVPVVPSTPDPTPNPTPEPDPVPEPEPEIDYAASASDLELFAALIECEAGSTHYEGMLAVASVVVNRMNSSYYPDTLRGVIYQSGQFPPAHNGSVDKKLKRGVKDSCLQVAQDALSGKNNVGDCLSFRAASSGHAGTIIGGNVFF